MNRLPENGEILLQRAADDGRMVRDLLRAGSPAWGAAFHAQQCVEKAIKAVLSRHSVLFPRTHDLETLVELLRQNRITLPPDAEDLSQLTPFGAVLRYGADPGEAEAVPDSQWLLDAVQRSLEWAQRSEPGKPK